jgi:hypothetical protein
MEDGKCWVYEVVKVTGDGKPHAPVGTKLLYRRSSGKTKSEMFFDTNQNQFSYALHMEKRGKLLVKDGKVVKDSFVAC